MKGSCTPVLGGSCHELRNVEPFLTLPSVNDTLFNINKSLRLSLEPQLRTLS